MPRGHHACRGVGPIGSGHHAKALESYSLALEQLNPLVHSSDDKVKELLHQLRANMALCLTHLERWDEATSSMDEALKLDPDNLKYETRAYAIAEKKQAAKRDTRWPGFAGPKTVAEPARSSTGSTAGTARSAPAASRS